MQIPEEPTGFVSMPQGDVAYWRVGTPGGLPVVCLHGGPGLAHDYLEPLAGLGADREVVFYDQAGCGRSHRRPPASGWSIPYFVDELGQLVDALGLDRFHLFGHSYGGWLALEYVLGNPAVPPASLSLNSTPPGVQRWITEINAMRAQLPADLVEVMQRHERAGSVDAREYRDAFRVFNQRHMCRVQPWPDALRRASRGFGNEVYQALWGTSEFGPVTGALKDWDVTPRLPELRLPTLVTCGRHDESTPEHVAVLADSVPGAKFEVFEHSSHMAFLEESDAFVATVARFLAATEGTETDGTRR